MNMLELVQEFARRTGQSVPAAVAGGSSTQIRQYHGLLNEMVEDLVERKFWQRVRREKVHVATASEDQGDIATLSPGFEGFIKGTVYNRTDGQQLTPITDAEWQQSHSIPQTGPFHRYRLRQGRLLIFPAPGAGQTLAWEYHSHYFVRAVDGVTFQQYFQADTDIFEFGDDVAVAWLRWRWKAEKGLQYAEEFAAYERKVAAKAMREVPTKTVDLTRHGSTAVFGIGAPDGSWPLP